MEEINFQMFGELYDSLIQIRYNYGKNSRQYHDFDISKLRFPFEFNDTFDINKYILSSRIRITRNFSSYIFPTFATRAERRRIENKLKQLFEKFIEENHGNYYRLSMIDESLQEKLINVRHKYENSIISLIVRLSKCKIDIEKRYQTEIFQLL